LFKSRYSSGELSLCNSDQPPATGWETTSKADKDGKTYYAPPQEKKAARPRQTRYWEYPACNGSPLVRVVRFDSMMVKVTSLTGIKSAGVSIEPI